MSLLVVVRQLSDSSTTRHDPKIQKLLEQRWWIQVRVPFRSSISVLLPSLVEPTIDQGSTYARKGWTSTGQTRISFTSRHMSTDFA